MKIISRKNISIVLLFVFIISVSQFKSQAVFAETNSDFTIDSNGVLTKYNGLGASLNSINVDSNNTQYASDSGILFNKSKTMLIACPAGLTCKSYSIPSSITSIGKSAFCDCESLSSITIPSSVTSIDNYAFYGDDKLITYTKPNSYAENFAKSNNIPIINLYSCDANCDQAVDIKDIAAEAKAYNVKKGNTLYSIDYDINNDGIVDIYDFVMTSRQIKYAL